MTLHLGTFAQRVYETSVIHGFHKDDKDDNFGEKIALIHSEVSEALEAHRAHGFDTWYAEGSGGGVNKPEGVTSEMADAIIRILDACVYWNLDIEAMLVEKANFNETRPFRHGKAY
jgi:hypothetical protein